MYLSRVTINILLFSCATNGIAENDTLQMNAIQTGHTDTFLYQYLENQYIEPVSSNLLYGSPHLLETTQYPVASPHVSYVPNDWMLLVLVISLLFLSVAWYNFHPRVALSIKAFFALRFFYQLDKEAGLFREAHTYFLYANFLMVIALLFYQVLHQYDLLHEFGHYHPLAVYGIILVTLILLYALKVLIIKMIAWVFNTRKANMIYVENIFVSNMFAGLLLLPVVFYNAFTPSLFNLFIMMGVLVVINSYKLLRGLMFSYAASGFSVYYLFLYLCGVELAPLLVIYKMLTIYLQVS
jgi:hypothetical protein